MVTTNLCPESSFCVGTAAGGNGKGGRDLSGESQTGAVMTCPRPRERAEVRFKGSE